MESRCVCSGEGRQVVAGVNAMSCARLTKSRDDYVFDGVIGGIAEYLGWSSTLLRVLFVVSGIGIGVYIALMLLMPEPDEYDL